MNVTPRLRRLLGKLSDKEYREAFVESEINVGLAFQIREMRNSRNWTQRELGEHAQVAQEFISKLENPGYGGYTLKTLRKLAAAFDVGLMVQFVPFSRLADWASNLDSDDLAVPSFDDDMQNIEAFEAGLSSAATVGVVFEQAATGVGQVSADNTATLVLAFNENIIPFRRSDRSDTTGPTRFEAVESTSSNREEAYA